MNRNHRGQFSRWPNIRAVLAVFSFVGLVSYGILNAHSMRIVAQEAEAAPIENIQPTTTQVLPTCPVPEPEPEPKPLSVKDQIRKIAYELEYDNVDFLLALADCESSFDPKRTNAHGNNPSWSVDRGVFQFNSHWQKSVSDKCAFDVECATRTTIKMLKAGKSHLWVCTGIVKPKLAKTF